jgi:peptidoglycan hydrolase-like protein with peptidoglycan-binding domain
VSAVRESQPAAARDGAVAPGEFAASRRPRRRRWLFVVLCVLGAGAVTAWVVLASDGQNEGHGSAGTSTAGNTARVARRTLVDRETVDGVLGYSGSRTVTNQLRGTLTRLPSEGSVVGRGGSLYEVDGNQSAFLMYGARPTWRPFNSNMSDGEDVRQLEQNLSALGYDTGTVDDDFTDATKTAIEAFQDDRGLDDDGTLDLGEVVFLPGKARIASRQAATGMTLQPGQEVLRTTTTKRVVTAQIPASRRELVARGDSVVVELPDGQTTRGRIAKISRVAQAGQEGEEATVDVTVVLRGRARGQGLDQAPVTVGFAQQTARRALSVPVAALLALEGGRTGVEVVGAGGARRVVRVTTGLFADGYVEIEGRGIRPGTRVVVPDEL